MGEMEEARKKAAQLDEQSRRLKEQTADPQAAEKAAQLAAAAEAAEREADALRAQMEAEAQAAQKAGKMNFDVAADTPMTSDATLLNEEDAAEVAEIVRNNKK